jgi:pyruvate dehydrogenase E2 component (dihydrolipoamide acetyltransferase)
VEKGELIAIVESDKSNVELESIASGIVLEHLFPAGEAAPVGASGTRNGRADEYRGVQLGQGVQQKAQASKDAEPKKQVSVSPVARRFAEENKIDLAAIKGTGSGGRITLQDAEAAARTSSPAEVISGENGQRRVLAVP